MSRRLSLGEIERVALDALVAAGAGEGQARPVARATRRAEADGIPLVGLRYLGTHLAGLRHGKVDGHATPAVTRPRPALVAVDGANGFAHPAFEAGLSALIDAARAEGVATLGLRRAYTVGVLGHLVEDVAARGLVALAFTNAPPNVAPWGGRRKMFGTNPLAFAAPREGAPLVFDMATTAVARVTLNAAAERGAIPEGWLLDAAGRPTTDPADLPSGSMAPLGGAKGAALALLVDLLAGGVTGASFSSEMAPFHDADGRPPDVGLLVIALDPSGYGPGFLRRLEGLAKALLAEPGVRLPGDRRLAARARSEREGVAVDEAVLARLRG